MAKEKSGVSMWDVHGKIIKKQTVTDEELNLTSQFFLLKHLSGSEVGTIIAQTFNFSSKLSNRNIVRLIQGLLPHHIKFIKYPSKSKNKDQYIELIRKLYNVNYDVANMYYEVLSTDDLIELKESQNTGGFKR